MFSDWIRCDVTPSELRNLLRIFEDCASAPLGLHNLLATATRLGYENAVGRWYKASEAFLLIKYAFNLHFIILIRICVYIERRSQIQAALYYSIRSR